MYAEAIKALCNRDIEVVEFDIIDSTNAEAKRRADILSQSGELTPHLFISKEQTAGRGRMGRSFSSRANSGIYMSLLYFTDKPLSDAVSVTVAAAAIIAEEIEKVTERSMMIKWVNDIYNENGKVCGILVESIPVSSSRFGVIVGIGINTGEGDFPEELRPIASSVGNLCGKEAQLISGVAERLLAHSDTPDDRSYMQGYRKRLMLLGEKVNLLNCGEIIDEGVVAGVDDDGGLLFVPQGKNKTMIIRSGEISLRIKNKHFKF